jgi:hypothetical protein
MSFIWIPNKRKLKTLNTKESLALFEKINLL